MAHHEYVPTDHCGRWLAIGVIALLIDLILGVTSTVLEFQHWGEDGFKTDVYLVLVALIPQCFVAAAYLVLARESQCRGLWKSTAGICGSYLLLCLLGLGLMEVLGEDGDTTVIVVVGFGILGLLGFCISGVPHFTRQTIVSESDLSEEASDSSEGPGWIGGFGLFVVFLILRGLYRRFIRPVLGVGMDVDDWQLIELLAIAVFGLSFALWFAITKIRHRRTLGTMASVTGWTEILILLIHVGLAITIFAKLISEAEANPLLDDNGVDRLLDPWTKRASLISAVSHAVWAVLTGCFFISLRRQSQCAENEDQSTTGRVT